MSEVGYSKYHVVLFLDTSYKGPADHVCVPRSWVQSRDEDDPLVNVWYPDEDPKYTEKRVRKRKQKSDQWEFYLAVVKYSTDSYEDAKLYIQKEINQDTNKGDYYDDADKYIQDRINKLERKNGDHTKSLEKAEETNAKIDNDYLVVKMLDARGWCVSLKSANTMTIKRKVLHVPDKEAYNKRSRETESEEPDYAIAGPSKQAFKSYKENLSHIHEAPNEDQFTKETSVKKTTDRNGLENRQTGYQNHLKENHSLEPEIFAQLTQSPMFSIWSMSELQNILRNAMVKELLNNQLNTDTGHCTKNNHPIAFAPRDMTAEAPILNNEKSNENQPEVNDTDDATIKKNSSLKRTKGVVLASEYIEIDLEDQNIPPEITLDDSEEENENDHDYEPVNKRSSPKQAKKIILPPDYDPIDTTWTLRYREHNPELNPELVELVENTGVYVSAIALTCFQRTAREGTAFARMLLTEIFTTSALSTCSWTGTRARAYDPNGTNIRPELDRLARTVLLNYATYYAAKQGWPYSDRKTILSSVRNKMQKMRP